MEKQFKILVDENLRSQFIQSAKDNDSDASKEVRKFMKNYVAKHGQKSMKI